MQKELLLKLPPIEVGAEAPFKHDRLNREPEIVNLTKLIKTNASPLVMAVNSPWGTGKTAFIKMWAAHIRQAEKEKVRILHFNAWESDFVADPLVSFLAAMEEQMHPDKKKDKEKWGAVIKAGKELLPLLVGASAGGLAGDVAKKAAALLTDDVLADKTVKSCINQKRGMQEFKCALGKYIKTSGHRVVIFVDELDRCRPDFAVKVLERIKHLFDVPRVTFVLALDRQQLRHSVKGLYGSGLNADVYLRRFIDFDYTMKEPPEGAYWEALLDDMGTNYFVRTQGAYQRGNLYYPFLLLGKIYDFSLRDAEQFMLRFNLVLAELGGYKMIYPEFLAFLLATREKAYARFVSYRDSADAAETVGFWDEKVISVNDLERSTDTAKMREAAGLITACLIVAKHPTTEAYNQDKQEYEKRSTDVTRPKRERQYAGEVCACLHKWDPHSLGDILRSYIHKIELLDQLHLAESIGAESGEK